MSENVEGLVSSPGEPQENQQNIDDHIKKLEQELEIAKVGKSRILEESKGYKSKYQEMKAKIEAQERVELEKRGEFEKLLAAERENRQSLEEKYRLERDARKVSNVRMAVLNKAPGLSPRKVDLLLKDEIASNIKYDEESLEIDNSSVDVFLEAARGEFNEWFTNKAPAQAGGRPTDEPAKPEVGDEEKLEAWKSFLS
jgi:hypothetical protein